jgi:hypothetical protein
MPGNPITERGGPINEVGIAIEVFQIAHTFCGCILSNNNSWFNMYVI